MSNLDRQLQKATKDLRARLGLTQAAFGTRIRKTLNTVLKYESQIAPSKDALIPLAALAIECGYEDLAMLFRTAIIRDFGSEIELVIRWEPGQRANAVSVPHDLQPLVTAFLTFMQAKNLEPNEELARTGLRQLLLHEDPATRAHKAKKQLS